MGETAAGALKRSARDVTDVNFTSVETVHLKTAGEHFVKKFNTSQASLGSHGLFVPSPVFITHYLRICLLKQTVFVWRK